jgi:hypothetical protein
VRFGLTLAVNALATITLGVTMVAAAITAVVLRRSRARDAGGSDGEPIVHSDCLAGFPGHDCDTQS